MQQGIERIPLTIEQKGIWFECEKNPTSSAYTVQWAYHIQGKLDIQLLEQSLNSVIHRHDALRTRFGKESGGVPYTYVEKEHSNQILSVQFLRDQDEIREVIRSECDHCFDLYKERLYRFTVIIAGKDDFYFLVVKHHLIYDGASAYLFAKELSEVYQGKTIEKPASNIHDWYRYQESMQELVEKSKPFWDQYMLGSSPVDLHCYSNVVPDRSVSVVNRSLPVALSSQVKSFSRAHKSTDFRTLMTAFQILLHRYTHSDDITIMYPKNMRPRSLPDLMGLHMSVQPCRVKFSSDTSFLNIIEQNNESFDQFKDMAPFNIAKLSSDDTAVLFGRSMYIFDTLQFGEGITVNRMDIAREASVSTFCLQMEPVGDSYELFFEYNNSKFELSYVEEMAVHYLNIVKAMIETPDALVNSFNFLSEPEITRLVFDWNDTATPLPNKNVIEIFEDNVARYPDHTAIKYLDEQYTYRQVNERANKLARYLVSVGVSIEDCVAVSLERTPDLLISFLAVLKAGGAYVPLDINYPQSRVDYIVQDCNAKAIIAHSNFEEKLSSHKIAKLYIDRSSEYEHFSSNDNLGVVVSKNSLLNVIYTSGTSGKPKGCMVLHRGVVRLVKNTNCFSIEPSHVVGQICNHSFDASSLEIYMALLNAATLVMIPTKTVLHAQKFKQNMKRYGVTHLVFSTGVFDHLVTMDPTVFEGLDTVIAGGDKMKPAISNRVLSLEATRPAHLLNVYGPTENSTSTSFFEVEIAEPDYVIPIGKSISNTQCYILDRNRKLVPVGVNGFLHTGGEGVARGYLNNPEQTESRFYEHEFENGFKARLYNTGDLARYLPDGNIEFLGRNDKQIKLRGYRIELAEIEAEILKHPEVFEAVVEPVDQGTNKKIVAYVKAPMNVKRKLSNSLQSTLPSYMMPSEIVMLDDFPLNGNGKVDIEKLKTLHTPRPSVDEKVVPTNGVQRDIEKIWATVLSVESVNVNANFFDLGGNSLLLAQLRSMLSDYSKKEISLVDLYKYTTIEQMAEYLCPEDSQATDSIHISEDQKSQPSEESQVATEVISNNDIAIIGIAGRFPGSTDMDTFWDNICNGRGAVSIKSKDELIGLVDDTLIKNPNFIPSRPLLDDIKGFDAGFFNVGVREAALSDPQHRILMECVWEALESSGHTPSNYDGRIGLFAGCGLNYYSPASHLQKDGNAAERYQSTIQNEADFLCSKIAYKLNLKGPAVTVQTACSTSLVAVHMGCNSIIVSDCDIAIAGGVSLGSLDALGYIYEEGMIYSKDGLVRPFDKNACGVVAGQGAAVVVMKSLTKAIKDRNTIFAVIKGSAINNDGGANKVGFTAPSEEGISQVIMQAQRRGNVDPSTVSYIETHGTATELGDQIEFAGLQRVFSKCQQTPFCALSSVKSMLGHLDTASGATGLITAALALKNKQLPPIANFSEPHPKFHMESSPFYVNSTSKEWKHSPQLPRRAGVNSMGIGGTNAHVVLEEFISETRTTESRPWQIVSLSAKTPAALEVATSNMMHYLKKHPENMADAAYTLHVGRDTYQHKRFVVCDTAQSAIDQLSNSASYSTLQQKKIIFMFPGSGNQYVNMSKGIYDSEPLFRQVIDECLVIINRIILTSETSSLETLSFKDLFEDRVNQIDLMQPLIFCVEYALAKLIMSWGIMPSSMIGHSLGEYTAACLAGVFTLEDALAIIMARGSLAKSITTKGCMLAVSVPEDKIAPYLRSDVNLAAVNGPNQCVLSGSVESIDQVCKELSESSGTPIQFKRLRTETGYHSYLFDSVLDKFSRVFDGIVMQQPQIPIISSMNGTWMQHGEATSSDYWVRHLRDTVHFSKGVFTILSSPLYESAILLEVGPSSTLSSLAKTQVTNSENHVIVPLMRRETEKFEDMQHLLNGIGRLWACSGVRSPVNWNKFYSQEQRLRIPLPTYPFQRQQHWIHSAKSPPMIQNNRRRTEPLVSLGEAPVVASPREDGYSSEVHHTTATNSIVGGHNDLQRRIIAHWQQTLGLQNVTLETDFFDAGGDSLSSIGMLSKLGAELRMDLMPSLLIEHRTVSKLVKYIEGAMRSSAVSTTAPTNVIEATSNSATTATNSTVTNHLVLIQKGKPGKIPIVLVHAIAGHIFEYVALAKHLGDDQPLYAFEASSGHGNPPFDNINDMARVYVNELVLKLKERKFVLGGHSFGGIVALEMSHQMQQRGYHVPLLVLLDSPILKSVPKSLKKDAIVKYMSKYHAGYTLDDQQIESWLSHQKAMTDYAPAKIYEGTVLFVKAEVKIEELPISPEIPWHEITASMHLYTVAGDHATMLRGDNVEQIVRIMSEHMPQ